MTADERMTISSPEDILGYIPHVLGLWPEESLVAMTMRGKTLGATLRVDLPPDFRPERLGVYSERIREYLAADELADGVLLVVYAGSGWEDGSVGERYRLLLAGLEAELAMDGLVLKDAWLIGPRHWRSAFCEDPGCCPSPGRPIEQIHDSRLNAEMVFRGSNVLPAAPAPGTLCAPADPGFAAAEDAALEQLQDLWRDRGALEEMLGVWAAVLDAAAGLGAAGPGAAGPDPSGPRAAGPEPAGAGDSPLRSRPDVPELDPGSAAFLRATLRIPAWRDAVTVAAAAGRETAIAGAEAFGILRSASGTRLHLPAGLAGMSARPDPCGAKGAARKSKSRRNSTALLRYGDVLLGLHPEVPDWKRLQALDRVLEGLAARGGGEAGAAALTLRGWVQWSRGSGSFADALLSQAEAEYPGYRLAALLSELVHRGTLSGWAKNRVSSWSRFGGAAA